ncbi:MAG: hypothetical protein A2Y40_04090 [Candidatus Margulisbacteria bacterium GWF2_35_9]|nr:MAG: hypothetical protein A2Y40_04090 [Candidatus Margulisbacteria bacterium GWF2_35_9]
MLGNMGNMMKQIGELKKQMKELKKIEVEVSSKNNEVTIKCNGEMKILDVKIKEDVDVKKLPMIMRETINKAMTEAKNKSLGKVDLSSLNIPGM